MLEFDTLGLQPMHAICAVATKLIGCRNIDCRNVMPTRIQYLLNIEYTIHDLSLPEKLITPKLKTNLFRDDLFKQSFVLHLDLLEPCWPRSLDSSSLQCRSKSQSIASRCLLLEDCLDHRWHSGPGTDPLRRTSQPACSSW